MNEPYGKPWGTYQILHEDPTCKVKKLTVKPDQQLSLQYHLKRQEHWVVVSGHAEVTIGRDVFSVEPQQSVFIPYHALHRLKNVDAEEDLVVIEVQTGEYFGENDITRIADDYDRLEQKESVTEAKVQDEPDDEELEEIETDTEILVP